MSIILNMGMFSWFNRLIGRDPVTTFAVQPARYFSMSDWLIDGGAAHIANREQALSIPGVLRGRNMICNTATIPLVLLDPSRAVVRGDPALLEQIDPDVANVVTLAQTIEDLMFDGVSWWEVMSRGWNGFPATARHLDSQRVTTQPPEEYLNRLPSGFDPRSTIYVDGKPRSVFDFIRFDSPNPALMVVMRRTFRRAMLLEDTAAMYAEDPRAMDYFTPKDNAGAFDEAKVESTIRAWIAARKKRATGFVPETLEYNTVQAPNPQELQLSALQKQAGLDVANALGLDPEDLGISTTSRTYQNDVSRRQDRVNDVLAGYMRAITDRLSMNDVTRRGYRVAFVLDDYLKADPATRWEIAERALKMRATNVGEIREREDWPARFTPPPAPAAPPAIEPAVDDADADVSRETIPVEQSRKDTMSTGRQTFDGAPITGTTLRFGGDSTTFAVDPQSRTITGTILVYDEIADNGEGRFRFRKGSLRWQKSAVSRVKMLRDHDWKALLGAATKITDTGPVVSASFKVARGPAGDQALAEAEDQALDGLSAGLDIIDYVPMDDGTYDVIDAVLYETSLTPRPAFDSARVTSVAASNTGGKMNCTKCGKQHAPDAACTPDTGPTFDYAELAKALAGNTEFAKLLQPAPTEPEPKPDERPDRVNGAVQPTPTELSKQTSDTTATPKSPYRFDRAGRFVKGEHEFSTDIVEMLKNGDGRGTRTEFGKRAMAHIAAQFDVDRADVATIQPSVQRPDMYYQAPEIRTPLWDMINGGALPEGPNPFVVPKFNTATNLVNDHTEGVEPESGTFTTTSQTITPTALSGKVSITRETLERGGNPSASNLIWARMVREYDLAKEAAAAAFLATLTGAADITLPAGAVDGDLARAIKGMIVGLNFLPGYDWRAFAMEEGLYSAAADAEDTTGRPLYPAVGPSNADGTAGNLFQTLNVNGLRGVPAGELPYTPGAPNNSWLFDPAVVKGHVSAPERLEFAGTAPATTEDPTGSYAPVAYVDIALFGWKAFYNIDIAGVRQVIYDETAGV